MTDETTPPLDVAAFYRPLVSRAVHERLLLACAEVAGFCELAQRASSARYMAAALESVVSTSSDINEWLVKVTAHCLDALVERDSAGLLETIAHEDFLLGECHGYSTEYIADACPLHDGSDAAEWLMDTGTNCVTFSNVLVRDYFLARYIRSAGSSQLLRFEYPRRWVLLFLAILAPELVTSFAESRSDRIRAQIELEVEQKVQAALSHQLKRSAGAVRSHLKAIRRKLAPSQFDAIAAEFDRIAQEVDFQIALSERTSMWSAQPELHIEDVSLAPEIETIISLLRESFPTVDATIDAPPALVSRCDRQLFREAFYCLAENAFQAATERTGGLEHRVEIRAQRTLDSLTIRVEVLDSGPGVHPEDRERIFQPRVTTKKGGNGRPLGTGMGLPIARKYAELMGGRIGMDPQGARTCFFIELPATTEQS